MADPKPPFSKRYDDGQVRITVDADPETRIVSVVSTGKGNAAGSKALLAALDEVFVHFGADWGARFCFDVGNVSGAPITSQMDFGKWFMNHKKIVIGAAIVGAGFMQRKLAGAATAIAGVKNFRFFTDAGEARAWLMAQQQA
jgi:hypothetical protein